MMTLRVPQAGSAHRLARLLAARRRVRRARVHRHRQAHALRPVEGADREAQPVARHGRGRDVHRDRDHRRRRRCTEPGPAAAPEGAGCSSPQRVSPDQADGHRARARSRRALLASVFVIAACGLVYELVAGAPRATCSATRSPSSRSSSATYLFAMGVGSWLSRYSSAAGRAVRRDRAAVALLGGVSAPRCSSPSRTSARRSAFVLYRLRGADRHPGRARDPARDAHPARPARLQGAGRAGADVRLPRRARACRSRSRCCSCRSSA